MTLFEIIFSLNLVLLAADHLFAGTLAMFFPKKAIKIYSRLFGAIIPETKEYFIILKPWGALGIFAGLVGLLPLFDPKKYIFILWALVVLLTMRVIYRLKFQKDAAVFLKLSPKRNIFHVGLILTCASIIVTQIFFI